jgi:hypothetical protein
MGRERFLFLPFPRPVGPPFGILTYPDGRVGVIHRSAWKWNSPKFTFTILHSPSLIDLSQPHHGTVKSSMPHYILWSWIKIQVAEC